MIKDLSIYYNRIFFSNDVMEDVFENASETDADEKEDANETEESTEKEKSDDVTTEVIIEEEQIELATMTSADEGDKGGLKDKDYTTSIIYGVIGILIGFLIGLCFSLRKKKDSNDNCISGTTEEIIDIPVDVPKRSYDAGTRASYAVGRLHNVGKRSGQQDSFAVSDVNDLELCNDKGVIAIVADGMGGLSDGDKISSMVTLSLFKNFHETNIRDMEADALLDMVSRANAEVNKYLGSDIGKCGSTLVAAIIRDKKCHWISVGDSHIYLYRKNTLLQLNREHVYREDLDVKLVNGEITRERAKNASNKGALTSYIGMGKLEKIDRSITPLTLTPGDRLLFMTDGVFGTLSDEQIIEAMAFPIEDSVQILDETIQAINKKNQDNYTAVILECKRRGR